MAEMITVTKSRLNNIIKAGIAAAVAELTNNGQAPQAPAQQPQATPVKRGPGRPKKDQAIKNQPTSTAAAPVKRGPGRPKKDQTNQAPTSAVKSNQTVKSNNTATLAGAENTNEPKPRGRVPVVGPLMLDAMKTIFNRNGNRDVTFDDLVAELTARSQAKKDPIQVISHSTIRNYLTTMEGKLWDRSAPGKYIPNFRAA